MSWHNKSLVTLKLVSMAANIVTLIDPHVVSSWNQVHQPGDQKKDLPSIYKTIFVTSCFATAADFAATWCHSANGRSSVCSADNYGDRADAENNIGFV